MIYTMPTMFDIVKSCELQKQCGNNHFNKNNKMNTSGNDPTITQAMRYSQYVQHAKPKTIYVTSAADKLSAQGITYNPYFYPVLVSLQFTNLKLFNMPREKVFSRTQLSKPINTQTPTTTTTNP